LRELFGGRAGNVKRKFLNPVLRGTYSLRPQFATQREVERHFASLEKDHPDAPLKEGLFDLISNVLLIQAPGGAGGEFHFRLGMEKTPSFRQLDPQTQARLKDLCVDYFFRRQDDCWRREALGKLPALKRVTNMLICGEDLGMVPACVPEVMKQLGLLGLEIERMPKALHVDFSRPADAPYLSVVTPSTHDMSTLRGWWLEDKKLTQLFFNQELRQPGLAPSQCEPWINRQIVRGHGRRPAPPRRGGGTHQCAGHAQPLLALPPAPALGGVGPGGAFYPLGEKSRPPERAVTTVLQAALPGGSDRGPSGPRNRGQPGLDLRTGPAIGLFAGRPCGRCASESGPSGLGAGYDGRPSSRA
jgi:hypothetical protein